MKYLLLLVFYSILPKHFCYGIEQDKFYRAVYDYTYALYGNEKPRRDVLFLDIDSEKSKCYSYYTHQNDSLNSAPDGKVKRSILLRAAMQKGDVKTADFPHRRSTFFVTKQYESPKTIVKDIVDSDVYEYEVSSEDFVWNIGDSTSVIGGYSCMTATCQYHGREWEVWFTIDIPFSDGPWQFSGLPGLVVAAQDKDSLFCFKLREFGLAENNVEDWLGKAKKTTRKEYLARKDKSLQNQGAVSNAILNDNVFSFAIKDINYLELDFDIK